MKRFILRFALIAAIAGTAGYIAYGVYTADRDLPLPPTQSRDVGLQHGTAQGRRVNGPSWSFDYDQVSTNEDGSISQITGVHDGILYRKGKPYAHMTAERVTVNGATNDFSAFGAIHIVVTGGPHPRTLDTQMAIWTDANKTLQLNQPVHVDDGGAKMLVQNLTIDFKTGNSKAGPMKGEVRLGS